MPKTPRSVTLEEANLLWLRARAAGRKSRSLSQALDDVLTEARRGGPGGEAPRSVVGTVDIAPEDPSLAHADGVIRSIFDDSLKRPFDDPQTLRSPQARRRKNRGRTRRG